MEKIFDSLRSRWRWIISASVSIFLILAVAIALFSHADKSASREPVGAERPSATGVESESDRAPVKVGWMIARVVSYRRDLTLSALARPAREAELRAQAGGEIKALDFEKGSEVARDKIIAELDVALIEANVRAAQARASLAKMRLDKLKELAELDGAVTPFDIETRRLEFESARAEHEALLAALDQTRVKAPFDGVALYKDVEVGEVIAPLTLITTIADLSKIKLSAGLPESVRGYFSENALARARFDESDEREGRISYIAPELDERHGTYQIEILIDNADRSIWPNQSAKVTIFSTRAEPRILAPQGALMESERGPFLFTIDKDNRARRRFVKLSGRREDLAALDDPELEGLKIVVKGQRDLVEGDLLDPVERIDDLARFE